MQKALFEVLQEGCEPAQVAWSYNEQTFQSFPQEFINLDLTGPSAGIRQARQGRAIQAIEAVTIEVDSVDPLVRLVISVNGAEYFEDPQPGDTAQDIRDRFIAQLQQFEAPSIDVLPAGTNGIELTSTFVGAIISLGVGPGLVLSGVLLAPTAVLLTEATRDFVLSVECYSKGREPRNGAWDLCARALASLEAEDLGFKLDRVGVGMRGRGPTVDLTAIAGAHWESRAAFDVDMYQRSKFVRELGEIANAEILITYRDQSGSPVSLQTITS